MFLRGLLRHLRSPVIVILDNSSTHKGEPLQQLLRQHSRLHIEHFPSYAPELNPDEGVWSLAKRALANSCPNDLEELVEDVIGSINNIDLAPETTRLHSAIRLAFFFALEYCIIYAEINKNSPKHNQSQQTNLPIPSNNCQITFGNHRRWKSHTSMEKFLNFSGEIVNLRFFPPCEC